MLSFVRAQGYKLIGKLHCQFGREDDNKSRGPDNLSAIMFEQAEHCMLKIDFVRHSCHDGSR